MFNLKKKNIHDATRAGHHISLFIEYLMQRKNIPSEEGAPESALREAVKTTTYLPQEWVYDNFKEKEARLGILVWGSTVVCVLRRRPYIS